MLTIEMARGWVEERRGEGRREDGASEAERRPSEPENNAQRRLPSNTALCKRWALIGFMQEAPQI